ncbi:MAG TPA: hypothetical protein VJB12_06350 [Candidatus Nanoarchaeia archaeon]|nr:hypothetical protein [Candidatus Nanoarchaeia archaeon]
MENRPLIPLLFVSFRALFSNASLFIPYIISMAVGIGVIALPLFRTLMSLENNPSIALSPSLIAMFALFILLSFIFSIIIYGWIFAAIQPVVLGKKLDVFSEFKAGLSMSWTIFLQTLLAILAIALAAIIGVGAAMGIGAIFKLSFGLGMALAVIAGALLLGCGFLFFGFAMHVGAVLIVDRAGALDSIRKGFSYMKSKRNIALKMALIAILLVMLSYFPAIAWGLFHDEADAAALASSDLVKYSLFAMLTEIPAIVVMTALLIFYSLEYKGSTAGKGIAGTATEASAKRRKSREK